MTSPRIASDPSRTMEALEARLEDGYARIESAHASGIDVADWETFWFDLLRQYQAACDTAEMEEAA